MQDENERNSRVKIAIVVHIFPLATFIRDLHLSGESASIAEKNYCYLKTAQHILQYVSIVIIYRFLFEISIKNFCEELTKERSQNARLFFCVSQRSTNAGFAFTVSLRNAHSFIQCKLSAKTYRSTSFSLSCYLHACTSTMPKDACAGRSPSTATSAVSSAPVAVLTFSETSFSRSRARRCRL